MSAALPTEEDILAFLVLKSAMGQLMRACLGEGSEWTALNAAWQETLRHDVGSGLLSVAQERQAANDLIVSSAIADSERRYAVECAQREVLEAARAWFRADVEGFQTGEQRLATALRTYLDAAAAQGRAR